MNKPDCNCADSPPLAAPQSIVNPAGANALSARVGVHATFLEEMKRRLSSRDYPQLARLRTRLASDPAIALLDAWATAGDVLTFYNERIANEGYLRTATEQRSLVELARLIGYRPGPGVAASVFLAFTLEKDSKQAAAETLIPAGTAATSVPGDSETPQTFETSEDLRARPEWNAIKPRLTIPQLITSTNNIDSLFLNGTDFQLKPNDRILLELADAGGEVVLTVQDVRIDSANKTTELVLVETLFSVHKLYRQISTRVDAFLIRAARTQGFNWLEDNASLPLTTLKNGDNTVLPKILPMQQWNRLSEFDERFLASPQHKGWVLTVPETKAAEAKTELDKPDSIFNTLTDKLRKAIEDGCKPLIKDMQKICDDLVLLDDRAIKFCAAVDHDALVDAGGVPNTSLNVQQGKLQDLFDASPANFGAAQGILRGWWGIKTSGGLNTRAQVLNDIFSQLKTALTPTASYPFTPQIEKIVQAAEDIASVTPLAGGPAQDRIDNLHDTVLAKVSSYVATLDALVNLPAAPTSTILQEVDKQLLKPIRTAPTPLDKHKLSVAQIAHEGNAKAIADAARDLADILLAFPDFINQRRSLFAVEAQKVLSAFDSLEPITDPSVKNAWTQVKEVLNQAQAKSLDLYATPLNITMDLIGGDTTGLIQLVSSVTVPGNLNLTHKLQDLARALRRLTALNGGSGAVASGPSQTSTSVGGIGQVTKSESETGLPSGNEILQRVANEVLSIPANTAADVVAQLAASFGLVSREELKAKWAAVTNGEQETSAALLSLPIQLFGHNAPRQIFKDDLTLIQDAPDWDVKNNDYKGEVFLSTEVQSIPTPSFILLQILGKDEQRWPIRDSQIVSRSNYGLTQKTTRVDLDDADQNWTAPWRPNPDTDISIAYLRKTLAIVPIKRLPLADCPLVSTIGKDANGSGLTTAHDFALETDQIELDDIYLGFCPGQWIAVEGERSTLPGVISRELCRISHVRHKLRKLPGDTVHTRIYLDRPLQHTYKRDTFTIYANVVNATHGQTVRQVLGSGEASVPFQKFSLSKHPLTYLAAPTANGVVSTLQVRVNNIRWHEQDSLLDSAPNSRDYVIQSDNDWHCAIQFGDGITGARLPTGRENVRAVYRTGLGTAGNVKAGAISQLAHRPLGVTGVTNPVSASGGADPESVDQIRANAPLAVMALDHLVSVRDYADFAQNYAAIDKAVAKGLLIDGQPTVHVTIAGAADIPIAEDSDLYVNLLDAYRDLGDPLQAVNVQTRELLILFLSAGVRLLPDYEWADVEPKIREALYDKFSFTRRDLAQDVYLSEVQTAIQSVEGALYADVDVFAALSERAFNDALKTSANPNAANDLPNLLQGLLGEPQPVVPVVGTRLEWDQQSGKLVIRPAQLAYLSRDVPDSLFLREITP